MGWEVQPGMSVNPFSYSSTAFVIYALYYCISLHLPKPTTKEPPKAPMVAADGAEERF